MDVARRRSAARYTAVAPMTTRPPRPRRRAPAPRAPRPTSTVDFVLVAAEQLLDRSGLAAFNTNAIAERAGVGIATVYRHFASKEEILEQTLIRNLTSVHEATLAKNPLDTQTPLLVMGSALIGTLLDAYALRGSRLGRVMGRLVPRSHANVRRDRLAAASNIASLHLAARPNLRVPRERHGVASFILPRIVAVAADVTLTTRPAWLGSEALRAEVVSLLGYRLLEASEVSAFFAEVPPAGIAAPGPVYEDHQARKMVSRRDAAERRSAILAAAEALLERKDFAAISMREVGRQASVEAGTLYGHFESKEALVAEVLCRDARQVADALEPLVSHARGLPLRGIVDLMVGGLVSVHRARPAFYRSALPYAATLGIGREIAEMHDRIEGAIRAALADHPEVAIPAARLEIASFLLSRVPTGVVQSAVIDGPIEDLEFERELAETFYQYITRR